jgi:hypothetical protein
MVVIKFVMDDIKKHLNNIKVIYQDYLKKLGIIRSKEKAILSELTREEEKRKIEEIRNSIK